VITGMIRTYTFAFDPEPEGGFTVTCSALPGLVTYGETLEQARAMAQDAMDGLIEVMLESGETVPESDAPKRCHDSTGLRIRFWEDNEAEPIFEQLSTRIGEKV
jgi:antitoxin HicB